LDEREILFRHKSIGREVDKLNALSTERKSDRSDEQTNFRALEFRSTNRHQNAVVLAAYEGARRCPPAEVRFSLQFAFLVLLL